VLLNRIRAVNAKTARRSQPKRKVERRNLGTRGASMQFLSFYTSKELTLIE
jgi:hypothetical protein